MKENLVGFLVMIHPQLWQEDQSPETMACYDA